MLDVRMEPTVSSVPSINESNPVNTADTDHKGFQVSGWKSDMERQSFWLHLKRPWGVHMYTAVETKKGAERGFVAGRKDRANTEQRQ